MIVHTHIENQNKKNELQIFDRLHKLINVGKYLEKAHNNSSNEKQ